MLPQRFPISMLSWPTPRPLSGTCRPESDRPTPNAEAESDAAPRMEHGKRRDGRADAIMTFDQVKGFRLGKGLQE